MAVNVRQLPDDGWKSTHTRRELQALLKGSRGQEVKRARARVVRTHHQSRAVIKYFDEPATLEMCDLLGVEPVLTKAGQAWVRKHGPLTYTGTGNAAASTIAPTRSDVRMPPQPVVAPAPEPKPERKPEPAVQHPTRQSERREEREDSETQRRLAALRDTIRREVESLLGADAETLQDIVATASAAAAEALLQTKGAALLAEVSERIEQARPVIHRIITDRTKVTLPQGTHLHPAFDTVIRLLSTIGNPGDADFVPGQHVALIGPTGCGKTKLAEQVAQALGVPFDGTSFSEGVSESELVGALLPTGENGKIERVVTSFIKLYMGGGIFLMDEADAAMANVLLRLNQALANGSISLPLTGMVKRHPMFRCILSLNTYGTGANHMYVGRNKLDDATMDRVRMGQVELDYDRTLEHKLVPSLPACREWLEEAWRIRDNVNQHRVRRNVSTRAILDGCNNIRKGMSVQQQVTMLTTGWTGEELQKVAVTRKPLY